MSDAQHKFKFTNGPRTLAAKNDSRFRSCLDQAAGQGGDAVFAFFKSDLSALHGLYTTIATGGDSVWIEGTDKDKGTPTWYVAYADSVFLTIGAVFSDEGIAALETGTGDTNSFEAIGFSYVTLTTEGNTDTPQVRQIMSMTIEYAGNAVSNIRLGDGLKNTIEKLVGQTKEFVSSFIELVVAEEATDDLAAANSAVNSSAGEASEAAKAEGEHIVISEEEEIIADVEFSLAETVGLVLSLGEFVVGLILTLLSKRMTCYVRFFNATTHDIDLTLCFLSKGTASALSAIIPNDPITIPAISPAWTPEWIIGSNPIHYMEWAFVNTDALEGIGCVFKAEPTTDGFPGLNALMDIPNVGQNALYVRFDTDDRCSEFWQTHKGLQTDLTMVASSDKFTLRIATNQTRGRSPAPLDGTEGYNYEYLILLEESASADQERDMTATHSVVRPVRDRNLSLWQSAVEETVRKELSQDGQIAPTHAVLDHPQMQAAVVHVNADLENIPIAEPNVGDVHSPAVSKLHFAMAEAQRTNDEVTLAALQAECRKYATCDWGGWATCEATYLAYLAQYTQPIYYDWQDQLLEGQPNIDFGVIDYQLPNDARVAIIGDWGTGMNDASALLAQIMQDHRPTAIIHLGDIYYAGTPDQCRANFTGVFDQVFGDTPRVPIYSIPGNHEYYAMGAGYYAMLQEINPLAQPGRTWQETLTWQQPASYFCLRTADGLWQFLGADTGQDDYNPTSPDSMPTLRPTEVQWHHDKLQNFRGKTILLTHHQLFSTNSKLSGSGNNYNGALYSAFQPYFDRIAAWFWGHEHNLALFQNGFMGLAKGRLLGCSAYEESAGEDPYAQIYPQVPYQLFDGQVVRVGSAADYYNHGYAIIDFARRDPTDPIRVTYYQLPSWGGTTPVPLPSDQPALAATETLG